MQGYEEALDRQTAERHDQNKDDAAREAVRTMITRAPLRARLEELGKTAAGRKTGIYRMYVLDKMGRSGYDHLLHHYRVEKNEINAEENKSALVKEEELPFVVVDSEGEEEAESEPRTSAPSAPSTPASSSSSSAVPAAKSSVKSPSSASVPTPSRYYNPKLPEKHVSPLSLLKPGAGTSVVSSPRAKDKSSSSAAAAPSAPPQPSGDQFVKAQKYMQKTVDIPEDKNALPDWDAFLKRFRLEKQRDSLSAAGFEAVSDFMGINHADLERNLSSCQVPPQRIATLLRDLSKAAWWEHE